MEFHAHHFAPYSSGSWGSSKAFGALKATCDRGVAVSGHVTDCPTESHSVCATHVWSCLSRTARQSHRTLSSWRPCSTWQTLRTRIPPVALETHTSYEHMQLYTLKQTEGSTQPTLCPTRPSFPGDPSGPATPCGRTTFMFNVASLILCHCFFRTQSTDESDRHTSGPASPADPVAPGKPTPPAGPGLP